jgi:hypothetical protein
MWSAAVMSAVPCAPVLDKVSYASECSMQAEMTIAGARRLLLKEATRPKLGQRRWLDRTLRPLPRFFADRNASFRRHGGVC